MQTNLIPIGVLLLISLTLFTLSIIQKRTEHIKIPKFKWWQNLFIDTENISKTPTKKTTVKSDLTGEVNPDYLLLNKLQSIITDLYTTGQPWSAEIVKKMGFTFISRGKYIKAYVNNTVKGVDIKTFDKLRDFFVINIPKEASYMNRKVIEESGIVQMLFVDEILYCYPTYIAMDDAIITGDLSSHSKYMVFINN